ncbi:MAG: hypothetical protein WC459_04865, partial [Patescibacteria group bacterium]
VKHKKRVLLYSGGFVIMVIFIFANVKIAHLNDNLETSYCADYAPDNMPPPCKKLAEENERYNLYQQKSNYEPICDPYPCH